MKFIKLAIFLLFICCCNIFHNVSLADGPPPIEDQYSEQVLAAGRALKEGKYDEAIDGAKKATELLPDRFEAYYVLGSGLAAQGSVNNAVVALKQAIAKAPPAKLEALHLMLDKVESQNAPATTLPAISSAIAKDGNQPANDAPAGLNRLEVKVVEAIIKDVQHAAPGSPERHALLLEALEKTRPLADKSPDAASIWLVRAATATELDDIPAGLEAAHNLKRLKLDQSHDDSVLSILVQLDRKGWMTDDPNKLAALKAAQQKFEDSRKRQAAMVGTWKQDVKDLSWNDGFWSRHLNCKSTLKLSEEGKLSFFGEALGTRSVGTKGTSGMDEFKVEIPGNALVSTSSTEWHIYDQMVTKSRTRIGTVASPTVTFEDSGATLTLSSTFKGFCTVVVDDPTENINTNEKTPFEDPWKYVFGYDANRDCLILLNQDEIVLSPQELAKALHNIPDDGKRMLLKRIPTSAPAAAPK